MTSLIATRARAPWSAGALALLLLFLLPALITSSQLGLPTEAFIFALFALSYDVLFGFTGLISFGHALFIGAGAYTMAITLTAHHASLFVAFVIVLIAGLLLSIITGMLALRTRGVYFAMVTLALAQAAFTLAQTNVGNLTGGENGMPVTGGPSWLVGPGNSMHFYYVALLALVVGFFLLRLFVLSPAGRVWQAIRDNEQRALMIGYHPYPAKLLAYVVSGTVATLVGGLYALYIGAVSVNLLSADTTIQLLLMVIIGGTGSLWGAVIGAGIVRYLNFYLNLLSTSSAVTHLPHWLQQTIGQPLLIFGIIYLLLVVFFPAGVAGFVQQYWPGGRTIHPTGLHEDAALVSSTTGDTLTPNAGVEPFEKAHRS